MKWFLYSLACSGFIWFVFFKPMEINTATANELIPTETPEVVDTETTITQVEEEEINYDTDYENIEDTLDFVSEETPVVELPVNIPSENPNIVISGSTDVNLNNRFLLVIGSFGVKSNADRLLLKMKDRGTDAVIASVNGLYRVVTASANDKNEAKAMHLQFTRTYDEQAFILKQ